MGSMVSAVSAARYGFKDGLFAEFLNSANSLFALCVVGVISLRLNSDHHARTSCWRASVVVSDTNSDFGWNCSDNRCTLVSPR